MRGRVERTRDSCSSRLLNPSVKNTRLGYVQSDEAGDHYRDIELSDDGLNHANGSSLIRSGRKRSVSNGSESHVAEEEEPGGGY